MTTDAEKQTDSLIDGQPEVQQHAVDAEAQKTETQNAEYAELTDRSGLSFDPLIHQTDSTGSPKLTGAGNLKRRPGRKSGSTVSKPQDNASTQDLCQPPQDCILAASATVDGVSMLGQMIAGKEWRYIIDKGTGLDERAVGIEAFTKYYEAKGITDVPPGVIISIWLLSYTARHMTLPQTQTRIQKLKAWFQIKILKRRIVEPNDEPGKMEA